MGLTRARVSAVLTGLLVLFLAIAIYSPLHRHQAGKPFQCSLNNIDEAVAEAAGTPAVALVLLVMVAMVFAPRELRPEFAVVREFGVRGPPAQSANFVQFS